MSFGAGELLGMHEIRHEYRVRRYDKPTDRFGYQFGFAVGSCPAVLEDLQKLVVESPQRQLLDFAFIPVSSCQAGNDVKHRS